MTDLATTILAIKSDAQVTINNEDINQITWHDGNPTNITNEQILAKQAKLNIENAHVEPRKKEYPPIGDQLDMLWHSINEDAALKNKYFKFHQAILAVKSKYSK
jgi:hypothetical protein